MGDDHHANPCGATAHGHLCGRESPTRGYVRSRATQPEQSGEHTFNSNLLDHPRITAPALTPTEVGESKELTFDVAVTMTVFGKSGKLGEKTIRDTATITVEKRQASITTTLSGEGSISISTKTPT